MRLLGIVIALGALIGQASPPPTQVPTPDIDRFVGRMYGGVGGAQPMPYRLFVPKGYDKAKRYPLIVWLHGAGGRGTDNIQQISGDQIPGTRLWTSDESQAKNPAFVVAPQSVRAWTLTPDDAGLQPELRSVVGIVDTLGAEYPIDHRRVYLLGQSMGAGGAWNLVTNQPQRFAALVLIAPAGFHNVSRSSAAAQLPAWAFDGANSGGTMARELVDALKQGGGQPKFTVYPNAGHDIWVRVFSEPDLAKWLFAQAR
jgi:predicted peptidase